MKRTFAVAAAEFRSLRRAVQTWVVVAVAAGLAPYLYYAAAHGVRSGYGATAGSVSPRFLVHGFGGLTLLAAMAGLVLLAVAKDRGESIAAVAASRPPSNLSLAAGRTVALAFAAWLAPALLALATLVVGGAATATGFWAGDVVEPWSLAAFLLLDAPVALVAWTALIVLLRAALGCAWAAAAAAFVLLGLQAWALFALPAWLLPAVSLLPRFGAIASDVLPEFADLDAVAQQLALLLLAGGALCLAAAALAHRARRDDRGAARVAAAVVLGSLGAAVLLVPLAQAVQERGERAAWIAAHRERPGPGFDIERVAAQVAIDPGRDLRVAATLHVRTEARRDALAFRLNPGMTVAHVRADAEALEHRHEDGLLDVRLARSLGAGEALEVSLLATGVPDPRFAYLDEALDPSSMGLADGLLHALGTQASVSEDDYVALLPGVGWLPAAGPGFDARADLYELSLDVDLPPGWVAAGPGRRTESPAPGGGSRFGFRPHAPVAAVAVLASNRFERRSTSVAGVDVELLLHRRHMRNARFFEDAAALLRDDLAWRFASAADRGLPYPYGGLSVVEVPAGLRAFGGGRRMDSALAALGVVMVREHGFPTARFDFASAAPRYASARQEGGQVFAQPAGTARRARPGGRHRVPRDGSAAERAARVHGRRLPVLPGLPRRRSGAERARDRGPLPRIRTRRSRLGGCRAHGVGLVRGGARRGAHGAEARRGDPGIVLRRPGGGTVRTGPASRRRRHADLGHGIRAADPRPHAARSNGRAAGSRGARRDALAGAGQIGARFRRVPTVPAKEASKAVRQARLRVHPDVRLHPEVPLVALPRLVHLRIPPALRVLRRTRRVDDARVHDRPLRTP